MEDPLKILANEALDVYIDFIMETETDEEKDTVLKTWLALMRDSFVERLGAEKAAEVFYQCADAIVEELPLPPWDLKTPKGTIYRKGDNYFLNDGDPENV